MDRNSLSLWKGKLQALITIDFTAKVGGDVSMYTNLTYFVWNQKNEFIDKMLAFITEK